MTSNLNTSSKKDQVMELRSVVTQWVSNTVSKRQNNGSDSAHGGDTISTEPGSDEDESSSTTAAAAAGTSANNNSNTKQQMFESLRGKGSDLLEKLKQKGGEELEKIKHSKNSNPLPWQRKEKPQPSTDQQAATAAKLEP